jgi:GNAT superfamily N-acetyltransferase
VTHPAPADHGVYGAHRLRDGTPVRLRPLLPEDRGRLAAAFARLSPESRYHRFLAPMRQLSPPMLDHLVDEVDGVDHVAVVCETSDGAVGIGRYIRERARPSYAEAAVTVIDDWHGRGVGSLLTAAIGRLAGEHDVRYFTALVHADNAASLAMLATLGVVVDREPMGHGVVEVVIELDPEPGVLDG